MTRRRYGRGEHLDIRALWCQEATKQERCLNPAESDAEALSADRIVHPTKCCRIRATRYAGNELSTKGAGESWSRAPDYTKNWIGIPGEIPRSWVDTQAAETHSAIDA